MGQNQTADTIRFGPFELWVEAQELRKYGTPLNLSGQPIQVLILLTACPGKLITREELRRKLWQGNSFGDFDHGLNAAVNRLREKLGDSATAPRYIETLQGRGYRFSSYSLRVITQRRHC
jgi:DNA-binding response OmpR family regulator